jgi:mRNA-degrading endonuclease RelE of RelBE toxin-antitoxin system
MTYVVEFKPRALKDLHRLPERERRRVFAKIEGLQNDLAGDVKELTGRRPSVVCGWAIIGCCLKSRAQRW